MMSERIIKEDGTIYYIKAGTNPEDLILHNEEGPAVIYTSGTKVWCKEGKITPPDESSYSVIDNNGTKMWLHDTILHRIDGPAIEYDNGDKVYYYKGVEYEDKRSYRKAIRKDIKKRKFKEFRKSSYN